MSTVTTPTNVSLIQRDASGDNQWIDLLGSANTNKAIGFNGSGVVSALATPLLTATNTFTADQTVQGKLTTRSLVGTVVPIAASSIDWAAGSSFSKTLSANTTFTFANTTSGQSITVAVTNTASNYTVTWPTVKWPGDLVPTQSTGVQTDVYTFKNIGGVIYGSVDRSSRLAESFGVQYVKTWTQLQAAMAIATTAGGGVIYIDGTIIVPPNNSAFGTGGFDISAPNIVITGPSNGSSVIKLQAGVNYTGFLNFTINVNHNNITIENITIEGVVNSFQGVAGMPLGIHLARNSSGGNPGITNTVIRNVTFLNGNFAVFLSGGSGSPTNRNLSIINNKVRNCGAGFYLTWGLDQLLIDGNSIIGDGALFDGTKCSYDNAIYVGKGVSNARIVNNYCANFQRMGIEIYYPFSNLTNANQGPQSNSYGQNDVGFIVSNNTIKNVGSMGISFTGARNSIISNNTISDCVFIGLEIVGDDRNQSSQKPDRIVGVLCANNIIKNVKATPRRPYTLAPTESDYGYSAIPLNPTSVELPSSNAFSNHVALSTQSTYATGVKTFAFTTTNSYAGFEVGKQVMLKRTDNFSIYLIGTVTANDGSFITVNVTSRNASENLSLFSFVLSMYGLRTINIPELPIEWSGNGGMFNSIPIANFGKGTNIYIQSTTAGEKDRYFSAYVYSYVPNAATCEIFINSSPTNAFTERTGWIGFARQACTGLAIDQINGAKVIGNAIDTVLDSNSSERWGCQIILSENVIFENNLITRAGLRYLVVNASNHVVVRNNVLRSGDKLMVREAVTNNITVLGEDTNYPENVLANGSTPKPSGIYAFFGVGSIGYNVDQPYNGCRYIIKDNTVAGVVGINTLGTYINGAAIFSDQFSRPETVFDTLGRTKLKHNNSTDGYDITADIPSPVLDYSQKWNSATGVFAAYRFHADPSINTADSRIFDIAGGDEAYLYLKTYGSTTSNTLALGSKTFTISAATLATFQLATVPAGTFVRCTSGTAFVEGRVTTLVSPSSSSFTMLVTNNGGTGGPYASWTIQFDTSALFVDRTSKLNLRSDVVLDYHTGTKIGTAATQKLGFWNATPVAQPAAVADATDAGTTQTQLNALLARLRAAGIIAT